ncbi:hypothetical protein BDZ89DRAFT_1036025 [Hymenopellis radicata]|nr:hypothetical protein BDZ89DRAFT_1036025 [Hymenopellis radicata]
MDVCRNVMNGVKDDGCTKEPALVDSATDTDSGKSSGHHALQLFTDSHVAALRFVLLCAFSAEMGPYKHPPRGIMFGREYRFRILNRRVGSAGMSTAIQASVTYSGSKALLAITGTNNFTLLPSSTDKHDTDDKRVIIVGNSELIATACPRLTMAATIDAPGRRQGVQPVTLSTPNSISNSSGSLPQPVTPVSHPGRTRSPAGRQHQAASHLLNVRDRPQKPAKSPKHLGTTQLFHNSSYASIHSQHRLHNAPPPAHHRKTPSASSALPHKPSEPILHPQPSRADAGA